MISNKEAVFSKDAANKKITVIRSFNAPLEQVWKAWTESALLDQWWAPKPWKAITKSMDFREGGRWLYYMEGPDGSRHWCRVDYLSVSPQKSFSAQDSFCDENGIINESLPGMHWKNEFIKEGESTRVDVEINFKSEADLEKIIEMGFREGFIAALENLDALLM